MVKIDRTHKGYKEFQDKWRRVQDVVDGGEDGVKAATTKYLPQLINQEYEEYKSYVTRASFYPASRRTVRGITGLVFRKDPIIHNVDQDDALMFFDSIGVDGEPLNLFASKVFSTLVAYARVALVLDYPDDAEPNAFPYCSYYMPLDILDWRVERIGTENKLTKITLREITSGYDEEQDTEYTSEVIRKFKLENSVCMVETWEKRSEEKKPAPQDFSLVVEPKTFLIRGRPIEYIPVVLLNPHGLGAELYDPPILDIVNVNLSHYRNSADYEHGLHFTALPTPWASGFDVEEGQKLVLGSTYAWVSADPSAKAGFLEFTGSGLAALREALKDKESQMAILGARMLEESKRAVEAADTHKIRRSGEESDTARISRIVSMGLTKIAKWALESRNLPYEDAEIELNRDFTDIEISPQMIQTLMLAVQSGKISLDTFFYNLQRGEVIPEGRTLEEELDLIDQQPPMLGVGTEKEEEDEDERAGSSQDREFGSTDQQADQ